ncbi:MAG: redox-regulated ATPase YchF [Ignavibacteriales bacterium]|nr:redox-regulated ATPase YchF [Ignavibacteriales bacterium]
MGFKCGIVGLPNVGKSTLFNAITAAGARVANYPFTTIEPQVGVVAVPDKRLDDLAKIFKPPKVIPTTIEFVDIAGLVKNANKGEGLGNQFLSHIREVDAIVHVVRCFKNDDVSHVESDLNSKRDIEIIETELLLKDLDTVEKKQHETEKKAKSGDKKIKNEVDFYTRLKIYLGEGKPARSFNVSENEKEYFANLHLLSVKPVMFVANVDEDGLTGKGDYLNPVREVAKSENATAILIDAEMEAEIASMEYSEREEFLKDLGVPESGLDKVIHQGYALLNLITFFTHNEKELRAWTITKGTKAPQAAGKIHTDFERGFIRAEVLKYGDLLKFGSEHAAREKGHFAVHGHDYDVEDGDIIFFRFNV